MNRNHSDWHFPRDLAFVLLIGFGTAAVGIATVWLLPALRAARQGDQTLFTIALGSTFVGIVLLFFAKLPLYRQGDYFSFGSKALPERNRKIYRIAYGFIGLGTFLLLSLLLVL